MTKTISLKEAESLPNILGIIATVALKHRGIYTCKIDGKKVKLILKK